MNFRIFAGSTICAAAVVAALLGPLVIDFDPGALDLAERLQPPSWNHWFGCDLNGADLFDLIILGARTTFIVAFCTIILTFTAGIGLGLLAGYARGWVETVIMRLIDTFMAFPGILLAMTLTAIIGPSTTNIIFAISATGWTGTARLVHAQVLSLTEREYVASAHVIGASPFRIITRYLLPGVIPSLVVSATYGLSGVILVEAGLSFLGLGATDSYQSWGSLLNQGRTVLSEAPHLSFFPGLVIATLVLGLNFLGDGLRDLIDPKSHQEA